MTGLRRLVRVLALGCALGVAAAGCHKKVPQAPPSPPPAPPATRPQEPPPPSAPPPSPARVPATRTISDDEIFARKSLDDLTRELSDVYFDLDKSEVRSDARGSLQKDADWLKRWTSTQVTIEGHCDSRGSSEYNLALGSRRGTPVQDHLGNPGGPAARTAVGRKDTSE